MFTRIKLFTAAFAAASLLCAAPTHAQSFIKASAKSNLARALVLHDSAVWLYSDPSRAVEAANIHLREANLRGATDPEGVEATMMAARLFFYGKHTYEARKAMVQGAERALAMGDVFRAAQAYADAAYLTSGNAAAQLVGKAVALANGPLLSATDRATILKRVGIESQVATDK
jgi:hypothetical protein